MRLTAQEQKMLEGENGAAAQQSMEILFALGKIYKAEGMIPVTSAQISGVSYKTIGDAGLEYLQDMVKKGATARVPSFLNPVGMDRGQWKEMGVPPAFAKKQIEILDAYSAMGITMTCTCAPYQVGIRPKLGEHVAWSESSAVAFANSVLGARTNREGGPSALAAAICGVTPNYGLHLEENRLAEFVVDVEAGLGSYADFGAAGYFVGERTKGKNVAFSGIRAADEICLKGLGAAMAASGSNALFYAEGITPEYRVKEGAERITLGKKELVEIKERIGAKEKPQLITVGCPHASLEEIAQVAKLVEGRKLSCQLWVCTAKKTKEEAAAEGFVATIEKAGGRVVADTCMVVCPLEEMGYSSTGCNSGKAAKYLGSLCKQRVVFGDLEEILC
ncbi:MAG: aconitase X catalytic domain-containing protein [Candidatus Micrarchaeia archaeon]